MKDNFINMEPKKKVIVLCTMTAVICLAFYCFGEFTGDAGYKFAAIIVLPAVVIWSVYSYFKEKKDNKKADDIARCVIDESYFDTMEWRRKYIEYKMENPFEKPKKKTMRADLLSRYREPDTLFLVLLFFFFTVFSAVMMFKQFSFWEPIGVVLFPYLGFAFLNNYTGKAARRFLNRDIDYSALERSYMSGRMMTYKSSGIVLGTTHIHIFKPKNVYAIDLRLVYDVTRRVVRVKQYDDSMYTGDRFDHFAVIHARIPETGLPTTVEVQLNEYQVQAVIDEFHRMKFPENDRMRTIFGVDSENNVG